MKEGRDVDDSWLNLSFSLLPGWKKNTEKDMMIAKKSREMAQQSPHVNDVSSPIQTNSTLTMKS